MLMTAVVPDILARRVGVIVVMMCVVVSVVVSVVAMIVRVLNDGS